MLKIIVVDDHKLFRDGIQALLSTYDDLDVMPGVGTGQEFLETIERQGMPHVVLLDLTMPDMDGFQVLEIAKKEYPEIRFIALSMHDDGQYIAKCVRLGAHGYLLKNADEEELVKAIHTVASGKKYYNKTITELMIHNMAQEGSSPKPLSDREAEVLKLVSEGLTTKQIAEQLFVSSRTVETHRTNMMKKLAVQNTAELIKKAAQLRLI